MAITITKENFQSEVIESTVPVLVDFWAAWCGPCQMLSPVVDEIAAAHPEIKVGKINVDEQPQLAQSFAVNAIPTLLVFKGGKVVQQFIGVQPKSTILAALTQKEGNFRCTHTSRKAFVPKQSILIFKTV